MGVHKFEQLPAVLSAYRRRIDQNITAGLRSTYMAGGSTAVRSTPVDTGEARSNWQGSRNVPILITRPPYFPGMKLGISETANAAAAIQQMRAVALGFSLHTDRSLYIANAVGHIGPLNSGEASKQGSHMFEKAIVAASAAARRIRVLGRPITVIRRRVGG